MGKSGRKISRIGLFGGTFNPIHNGHLYLAREAVRELNLDCLYFVPSFMPPHKEMEVNIPASDRLQMVKTAVKGKKPFRVSLFEIQRRGKSYSIETIKYFKRRFGENKEYFFIIGADSLTGFNKWKGYKKLLDLANFAVIPRPGYCLKKIPDGMKVLKLKGLDVSSSVIRGRLRKGLKVAGMVPQSALSYINKKKLYSR